MPFLAPEYKPDGITVMRCTLADHGWLDPATLYMQCVVTNISTAGSGTPNRVPLTSSINGAFSRGRLLSGQLLEDILMYGRVTPAPAPASGGAPRRTALWSLGVGRPRC